MKHYHQYTDQQLVEAFRSQEAAFDEIYHRYWQRLYLFAYNLVEDQQQCEDIVQEIFTYLYTKRKSISITNLKAYLFQAVKFQVVKHLRKSKLQRHHVERMQAISFTNQTEDMVNVKQLETQLHVHLQELPERCRQIFYMSRFEQLSNDQIAKKLGLSTQTVKNQISNALRHLRTKIDYITVLAVLLFIWPD